MKVQSGEGSTAGPPPPPFALEITLYFLGLFRPTPEPTREKNATLDVFGAAFECRFRRAGGRIEGIVAAKSIAG